MALDLNERGVAYDYESEVLWYRLLKFSKTDFKIETASGKQIIVETKGWFPPSDKQKVLGILESNPEVDYRMLFQRENKRDIAWCRKHGVKYAVGTVPADWLDE